MFANLLRVIRSTTQSQRLLVGAVAVLALAAGTGSAAALLTGHRIDGPGSGTALTSSASKLSQSQDSHSAGNGSRAVDPSGRGGNESGGSANAEHQKTTCPPNPAPGSTVDGGLLVTGICHLVHVTVKGDVLIASTGHLELEQSTINGHVKVQPGGELDSGHTVFSGTATFLPSTIRGGIDADKVLNIDLDNATVYGTITMSGTPAGAYSICGSTLHGKLELINVQSPFANFPTFIGDPGEILQLGPHHDCPGNIIDGSVFVIGSHRIEIEANTITGSVQIIDSSVELAANKIGGSAHCRGLQPFTDGDHSANIVRGSNTCG